MKNVLFCIISLFYFLNAEAFCSKEELKNFLIKDASYIKNCQDNRVYLKNNCLEVTEEGMYVIDGLNQKIPLTELFSDSQGLYTRIESFGNDLATVYPIVWCRTCKAWRMITIRGVCGICGNVP
jgi:hypothetical protein